MHHFAFVGELKSSGHWPQASELLGVGEPPNKVFGRIVMTYEQARLLGYPTPWLFLEYAVGESVRKHEDHSDLTGTATITDVRLQPNGTTIYRVQPKDDGKPQVWLERHLRDAPYDVVVSILTPLPS